MQPNADIQLFILPIPEQVPPELEERGLSLMSDSERTRYENMGSEKRRRQFLLGHTLARDYCDLPIIFAEDEKPRVAVGSCHVSLSHKDNYLCWGLSPVPVGIDLEEFREIKLLLDVARYSGSQRDVQTLLGLAEPERTRCFYRLWSLKEALYKAADLSALEVRSGVDFTVGGAGQVSCVSNLFDPKQWQFELLDFIPGHLLALTYQSREKLAVSIKTVNLDETLIQQVAI